jgi:nitrate/nitrite transporter NarK
LAIACLLLGSGFLYAYFPAFWAIPAMMLSEAAAAATVGLIYSIGQIGGFVGDYAIGFLNDRTHSLAASFASIALVYATAGGLILTLRVRGPAGKSRGSPTGRPQAGRIVCEKGMVPSLDSGRSDD